MSAEGVTSEHVCMKDFLQPVTKGTLIRPFGLRGTSMNKMEGRNRCDAVGARLSKAALIIV